MPLKPYNQCQILAFQPDAAANAIFREIILLAEGVSVPAIVCCASLISPIQIQSLSVELAKGAAAGRKTVLLCGAYLEQQILVAAQYILATGLDLYLVRDMIVALDPDHASFHDCRLIQAGAVMTTSKQMVYEWATLEDDTTVQRHFAEFLRK